MESPFIDLLPDQNEVTEAPPQINFKPDHILLRVKNSTFDDTAKWYQEKFEAKCVKEWTDDKGMKFAYYDIGGLFKIEIVGGGYEPTKLDVPKSLDEHLKYEGYRHLCFLVDNIYQATEELIKKGAKLLKKPFRYKPLGNTMLAFFLDNNDNVIELSQPAKELMR